jgi:aldehyde dehydrogenase (NAD+)
LLAAAWKIAPALACGNTVVFKPAETTPLTALFLAQVGADAGLPPGVLNIVTGDAATGAALADHPDVDALSFTGSTDVGKALRRATAGSGKRLSLELGGKSALLLFEDAPLDQALESIVTAVYLNAGQLCSAGSRLLVQESIAAEVVERLRATATRSIRTPISARSTRAGNASASRASSPAAAKKGRSTSRPRGRRPSEVTGFPPRFSRTYNPRIASPGRRSAARCFRS